MEFRRLLSADAPLFAAAAALYEISFPEHEKRLPEKQRAVMTNPRYHFDVILEDNVFAGILLYWEGASYTYIEHFAIEKSLRGKALGSGSLEAFCENHGLVVLEIDPPVTEIAIRREGFYGRLGFKRNGYAHAHPAYRKKFPPHELVVMSCPRTLAEEEYRLFRSELAEVVMGDAET